MWYKNNHPALNWLVRYSDLSETRYSRQSILQDIQLLFFVVIVMKNVVQAFAMHSNISDMKCMFSQN